MLGLIGIATCKAPTHDLMNLLEVPIFSDFDNFKPYDNHGINSHNSYYAKQVDTSDLKTNTIVRSLDNLCINALAGLL